MEPIADPGSPFAELSDSGRVSSGWPSPESPFIPESDDEWFDEVDGFTTHVSTAPRERSRICDRAAVQATGHDTASTRLVALLKLPISSADRTRLDRRIRELTALFQSLSPAEKATLRTRLNDRADPLGHLFDCELHRESRRRLRALLTAPPDSPSAPTQPQRSSAPLLCVRDVGSLTALLPWERHFVALINDRDFAIFDSTVVLVGPVFPGPFFSSIQRLIVTTALDHDNAITMGSNIWFPSAINTSALNSSAELGDLGWLVHESVHVVDYVTVGMENFLTSYIKQAVAAGFSHDDIPHERRANRLEAAALELLRRHPELARVISTCDSDAILDNLRQHHGEYRRVVSELVTTRDNVEPEVEQTLQAGVVAPWSFFPEATEGDHESEAEAPTGPRTSPGVATRKAVSAENAEVLWPADQFRVNSILAQLRDFFLRNFSRYMDRSIQRRTFPFTIVPDADWRKVEATNARRGGEYLLDLALRFLPDRSLRKQLEGNYHPDPVPYGQFGPGMQLKREDARTLMVSLLGKEYNRFHSSIAQVTPHDRHMYFSASSVPRTNLTLSAGTIAHEMAHVYEHQNWYIVMNVLAGKADIMEGITGQMVAFPAARDWSDAKKERLPSTGYLEHLSATHEFIGSVGGLTAVLEGYFGGWINWNEADNKVVMGRSSNMIIMGR